MVHANNSLTPDVANGSWTLAGDGRYFDAMLTPAGLAEVKTYADGIGPWKYYVQSTACRTVAPSGTACADANGDGAVNEADRVVLPPTDLVQRAHARGLLVHTWTMRNERSRLPLNDQEAPSNEILRFFDANHAVQSPDLPPVLDSNRISETTMALSIAFAMS